MKLSKSSVYYKYLDKMGIVPNNTCELILISLFSVVLITAITALVLIITSTILVGLYYPFGDKTTYTEFGRLCAAGAVIDLLLLGVTVIALIVFYVKPPTKLVELYRLFKSKTCAKIEWED